MKRFTKNLLAAVLGLSTIGGGVAELQACPKGGGYGGGYSRPAPAYYPRPVYSQPCPTPVAQPRHFPQPMPQPLPQPMPQTARQGVPINQLPPAVHRTVSAQRPNAAPQAGMPIPSAAPAASTPLASRPTASAPATSAPATAAPAASANNAQMTALQVLAGMSGGQPQSQPAETPTPAPQQSVAQQPAASHVGNWTATLPNNATVQLALQADGSFTWTALSNGKTSAFDGTYSLENEALTLTRSSDNQRLTGTLTPSENGGFNFKLTGAKDAGLDFARG